MKVVTALITPPSMMPTSGTTRTERSGILRRMRRKRAVPARAVTDATNILPKTGVSGANRITNRMPRLADSTVPAVDGSTKRLRVSICMIMPATAIDMPARMIASVRGMRLIKRTSVARSVLFAPNSVLSDTSLTPINRLIKASMTTTIIAAASAFTLNSRSLALS